MKRKMLFCQNYGTNFLLDTYPANLAFSMFKLSSSYSGNCLRVVRSSDNATLDIGFVGYLLDTYSLLTFIGSNSGYVSIWYNQSSGNNATQTTYSNMPRIVNNGVLETLNGHPTLYFNSNDYFNFTNESVTIDFSIFSYGKRNASGYAYIPLSYNYVNPPPVSLLLNTNNIYYFQVPSGYLMSNSVDTTSVAMLLEAHSSLSVKNIYKNQSIIPSTYYSYVISVYFNNIGNYNNNVFTNSRISEVLLYKSNQIINRTEISNNILSRQV